METGQPSEARQAVVDALELIIRDASAISKRETDAAMSNVEGSQLSLERELQLLGAEMDQVTGVLETVTLDPETSARMEETTACLKRTKKKLTTIRGRLGRLRTYEESDRLRLAEREMVDSGEMCEAPANVDSSDSGQERNDSTT